MTSAPLPDERPDDRRISSGPSTIASRQAGHAREELASTPDGSQPSPWPPVWLIIRRSRLQARPADQPIVDAPGGCQVGAAGIADRGDPGVERGGPCSGRRRRSGTKRLLRSRHRSTCADHRRGRGSRTARAGPCARRRRRSRRRRGRCRCRRCGRPRRRGRRGRDRRRCRRRSSRPGTASASPATSCRPRIGRTDADRGRPAASRWPGRVPVEVSTDRTCRPVRRGRRPGGPASTAGRRVRSPTSARRWASSGRRRAGAIRRTQGGAARLTGWAAVADVDAVSRASRSSGA